MEHLVEATFADFSEGMPWRAQPGLASESAGILREVAFEAVSTDLMLSRVRNNLARALLPPAELSRSHDLQSIEIIDGPARIEYLAGSGFNPSPATQAFLAAGPGSRRLVALSAGKTVNVGADDASRVDRRGLGRAVHQQCVDETHEVRGVLGRGGDVGGVE